jgi:hypothetical protein
MTDKIEVANEVAEVLEAAGEKGMINFVKSSPLKAAAAFIGSIATIMGALWAFDSHYASAQDLINLQNSVTQQLTKNRADDLDDKIFALQLKQNKQNGKLDPVDSAMLDRYTRQLQMLQDQLKTVNSK